MYSPTLSPGLFVCCSQRSLGDTHPNRPAQIPFSPSTSCHRLLPETLAHLATQARRPTRPQLHLPPDVIGGPGYPEHGIVNNQYTTTRSLAAQKKLTKQSVSLKFLLCLVRWQHKGVALLNFGRDQVCFLPSVDGTLQCATVTQNIFYEYNDMILLGTIGVRGQ